MVLSVIIVNYNVRFFLEQCLYSVEASLKRLAPHTETEILVVDNHSTDGSVEYLQPRFPRVRFIVNTVNLGFSAANNQALAQATGRYILFLNPDTILSEDCCTTSISFLSATPGAGAAGLRMIDGQGRFLPESRRGFPSPWVAFSKLSGLAALFPRSRVFAGYYLGHLPATKNHPSPILSGACLWTRREVLDRAGNFDEQFFMYAEDIDLSYRIERAGYTNYYIADTTILHFKGESTRKGYPLYPDLLQGDESVPEETYGRRPSGPFQCLCYGGHLAEGGHHGHCQRSSSGPHSSPLTTHHSLLTTHHTSLPPQHLVDGDPATILQLTESLQPPDPGGSFPVRNRPKRSYSVRGILFRSGIVWMPSSGPMKGHL